MGSFFIDRPIFAWVISIVIMLAGGLAYVTLPVARFPEIAPPEVSIRVTYPGASAKTLEDTVTQVIEQQMKGLDNLVYMSSTSDSSGQAEIIITFSAGTDPDIAQVQVQNKLQLATPMLPEEVQRLGIEVKKAAKSFLLVMAFISKDGSMSSDDLSDYLAAYVQDPVSRVNGVGDVTIFGSEYAMRIWCDPDKMRQYKLIPDDVTAAVMAQNAQIPGGQIGGAPSIDGQQINMTVIAASRLQTEEQFQNILLRVNKDGSKLYLKDVARVEIGAERYFAFAHFNRLGACVMAVMLASGA